MSLNGILGSALSGLTASQAALSTVSNNIANMNTPGYVRRVAVEEAQVSGGQLTGVDIADVQRIADQYLNGELMTAQGTASQYSTQNGTYTQLNGFLGAPGDGSSLSSQLDKAFSALSAASLAPSSAANQQSVVSSFQNIASTISSLSGSLTGLQSTVDQQLSASTSSVNALTKQIYDLNTQISVATASGTPPSGLLDQRDTAVQQLSQLIGIKTTGGSNGQEIVSTQDGVTLVGDTYAQLSYQPSSGGNGSYQPIQLSMVNPATGATIGGTTALDPHLGSGKLQGYLDMRDGALAQLQQELGSFAQVTANSFNAQSNANSAYPPPANLSGRNTGLLSTDALNFSGKTTIAIADSSGNLVSRVDVDFGAGTLSVDGGAAASIGTTIGSFATALNGALGANGSASFANGQLSISAASGDGVVTQDDATTPASRGGAGFSQFFGLNDLFRTATPALTATGLSATDAGNFAAGGTISLALKNASGQVDKTASLTLNGTESIGTIVSALNTAFGGAMTFSLGTDGSLSETPAASYANDTLGVTQDTTARGTTGLSFTQLFAVGPQQTAAMASGFALNPAILSAPQTIPFAQASLSGAVAGDSIVTPGDARGLTALQNVASTKQSFAQAGALAAQSNTLANYAAAFYQDAATRSATAQTNNTTQSDRLTQAQSQQASVSGVNLDEELSNMMTYQQAYSASARVLQTVNTLYQTLLQIQ